jgi:putative FmdB family regulatory protein
MPIYEYACPKCRVIFSFFSKRIQPEREPRCPKCGAGGLIKQMSGFAALSGGPNREAGAEGAGDFDDPKMTRAMAELERDCANLDESNPKHLAHLMKKMKEIMPFESMPPELDVAIKRLEAGEDPEKIEAEMGDIFGGLDDHGNRSAGGGGGYSRDQQLYDY